jgi:hypothetical protein
VCVRDACRMCKSPYGGTVLVPRLCFHSMSFRGLVAGSKTRLYYFLPFSIFHPCMRSKGTMCDCNALLLICRRDPRQHRKCVAQLDNRKRQQGRNWGGSGVRLEYDWFRIKRLKIHCQVHTSTKSIKSLL